MNYNDDNMEKMENISSTKNIILYIKEEECYKVISPFFENKGYKVFRAGDSKELLRYLEDVRPFMIVIDDDAPEIMGMKVYEIIKKIERFKDIKVYILSSTPVFQDEISGWIDRDRINESLASTFEMEVSNQYPCSNMGSEEVDAHEKARRLARTIVSDMILYNREKVEKGLHEGTFYQVMEKELEEGRRFYNSRIPEIVRLSRDYFEEAIEELITKVESRK